MAFADPEMMVHEYLEEQGRIASFTQYLEDEMDKYKDQAVKRLYMLPKEYAKAIASTIAFGYDNQLEEACKIVEEFKLNEKHIYALLDDHRRMFEVLSEESLGGSEYDFSY